MTAIFQRRYIPYALIYFRLLAAVGIVLLALTKWHHLRLAIVLLLVFGLLSDVFDGIIARKLNVSTEHLRRLDSGIDQLFFICTGIAAYLVCPAFFKNHKTALYILLGAELMIYLVSFIKFKKEVATHAIASKFWVLIMVAAIIQIVLTCNSTVLFWIFIFFGLITRLEIILILLLLKQWATDVPSVYHAWRMRQGKAIKKNALFNG